MSNLKYCWRVDGFDHSIVMAYVEGTNGRPFLFGEKHGKRAIEISDFFMATVPVTQALWTHVMGAGSNPSHFRGDCRPVENVSWHDVAGPDGFLCRINGSDVIAEMAREVRGVPESAFDCLQKPNGNMPLVAGRAGLTDLSSAAATTLKRLPGMTGTVAGRGSRVFGNGDLVPIICSARKPMTLG